MPATQRLVDRRQLALEAYVQAAEDITFLVKGHALDERELTFVRSCFNAWWESRGERGGR